MKRVIISENKMNYLKDDGTYLLNEHVYKCYEFDKVLELGLLRYKDNTNNLINLEGKLIFKTNLCRCWYSNKHLLYALINDIWYYIDKECNFYSEDLVSFKELYQQYPNMRNLLIEIIEKYTYHNINEYFNI